MFFFYRNAEYRPNFPAELSALKTLIGLRKVRDFSKDEVSLLTTYSKNVLTMNESDRKLLKEARKGL
jgi:hypothetical protein